MSTEDSKDKVCYKELDVRISRCLQNLRKKISGSNQLENSANGAREEDVGITEFVQTTEARFTGLYKYRWSDFVVYEIDNSNTVVELGTQDLPESEVPEPNSTERPCWFPESTWTQLTELNASGKLETGDSINICVESLSKDDRRNYHTTIKSAFKDVTSNTCDINGEKFINVRSSSSKDHSKDTFTKHKPWPKDRPKYLHFCLYKQCTETFSGLSQLAQSLKINPKQFGFSGTKDARAKTYQRISVKQVTAERLLKAAQKCSPKLAVGSFCYREKPLRLGDLSGNRFQLALRNVSADSSVVARRIDCLKRHGFINYYGLQRFGARNPSTHMVGRALLQQQWGLAVDLLLSSALNGADSPMRKAQSMWLSERDANRALALLSSRERRTSIEGRLLQRLATLRSTACREAIDSLPANTRSLYVHAYQSWVWNCAVSRRLKRHGFSLVPGDLVSSHSDTTNDTTAAPSEEIIDADSEIDTDLAIHDANGGDDEEKEDALSSRVVVLTESDLSHFKFEDLVIPLFGSSVKLPENETADDIRQILAEDEINIEKLEKSMKASCAGSYRRVVSQVSDVNWSLVKYNHPDQDLFNDTSGDVSTCDGTFSALLLSFNLPKSCYATMVVREVTGSDTSLESQLQLNREYKELSGSDTLPDGSPNSRRRTGGRDASRSNGETNGTERCKGLSGGKRATCDDVVYSNKAAKLS